MHRVYRINKKKIQWRRSSLKHNYVNYAAKTSVLGDSFYFGNFGIKNLLFESFENAIFVISVVSDWWIRSKLEVKQNFTLTKHDLSH